MISVEPSTPFEAAVDMGTTGLVGSIGLRIIDNVGNTVQVRTIIDIVEDPAGSGLYQAARISPGAPGQYSLVWDDGDDHWAIDELLVTVVDVPAELTPGSGTSGGPCTDWISGEDVMACCSVETTDSSIFDDQIQAAQQILFELSGRQFTGICQHTTRPCRTGCACGWQMLSRGYVIWANDTWWCEDASPCGCSSLSTVKLAGYPVRMIVDVTIDGASVNTDTYELHRHRDLVRVRDPADPDTFLTWPSCQNLDLPSTEPGTFEVTYLTGLDPPAMGQLAVAQLACELYKQCQGEECDLPNGVTRITRQGVIFERAAFAAFARQPGSVGTATGWSTGMALVDAFLNAYNPAGLMRRPTIWSPATQPRFSEAS